MFELDQQKMEITAVTEIGPSKNISALIIDNFYAEPEKVRRFGREKELLATTIPKEMPGVGKRFSMPSKEVTHQWKPLFDQFTYDEQLWGVPVNREDVEEGWKTKGVTFNYTLGSMLVDKPWGLVPYQDSYPFAPRPYQFLLTIYLNTAEDCKMAGGGTDLYSFLNEMTIPKPNWSQYLTEKDLKNMEMSIKGSFAWKTEHEFPMRYNRAILFQTQVLHADELYPGSYPDFSRMTQLLYI